MIPDMHMRWRSFNRQMFNPTCIKNNHFDLHIATAKNCGTHWVKYMLSLALAERHAIPAPDNIRDDSIVGHTKTPPRYKNIPQIAITHSHPHYLMRLPAAHKILHLPKFVVLVRDMRSILVSMYEKTRGPHLDKKMHTQNVTFSQYLRGDPSGKTRIEDLYGLILFFNAWGAVQTATPENVLAIRYEDLQTDTAGTLQKICAHASIDLSLDTLARAVEQSSKNRMAERMDEDGEKIVNLDARNDLDWYSASDMDFLRQTCAKYLKHDFGYKF